MVKQEHKTKVPTYVVTAAWDPEAKVWVATSDDVPGLATGAETVDVLLEKLRVMVPELLEANGLLHDGVLPEVTG